MFKKKFKLSARVNIPCFIEIKNPAIETHGLLRLSNGDFCDFLQLKSTSTSGKTVIEKIETKTFLQLDLENYESLSINADFLDEAGFVEGEFYTGNWEEIILREIELSLSETPFFYTCDPETLKFSIGLAGQSLMEIELDAKGNFSVVSTIKNSSEKTETTKQNFPETSDGAEMINRLYDRLRHLAKENDFEERQASDKDKLAEQFNKTLSESFRFSK